MKAKLDTSNSPQVWESLFLVVKFVKSLNKEDNMNHLINQNYYYILQLQAQIFKALSQIWTTCCDESDILVIVRWKNV